PTVRHVEGEAAGARAGQRPAGPPEGARPERPGELERDVPQRDRPAEMPDRLGSVEACALEHPAEAREAEIRQVLGRVVVVPATAADAREKRIAVPRLDDDDPARAEQLPDALDRRARVAEVLDHVEERDDVEALAGQLRLLERRRDDANAELPLR